MAAPTPPPPPAPGEQSEATLPSRVWRKYRSWPIWAQAAIAVVLLLLIVGAAGGDDEEEPQALTSEAQTTVTTLDEDALLDDALADVRVDFLTDDELTAFMADTCEAMDLESTDAAASASFAALEDVEPSLTEDQVGEAADVIEEVAPQVCPDGVESHPDFISAFVALAPKPTTTTTTTTTTPTTTTTTAPPPPPPTTAAPPPPPPTTAAPAPPPSDDTYYANCDEAREAGAAPMYRGEPGYREGLDRDKDGIACDK